MRTREPTTRRRFGPGNMLWCAAAGALLLGGAAGAVTAEEKCQADRAKAAGKYVNCQQKAVAKLYSTRYDNVLYSVAAGKCVTKYAATWPKLVAKGAGSTTCVDPRFVDNGTTVMDQLTALQWEKKTDDNTVHDKDNRYTWSTSSDGDDTDADGTAFTGFLASLKGGACFAGQCDWRLPTRDELLTIVNYPACTSGPCIDPIFGPTAVADIYWSATTFALDPVYVWFVTFSGGYVGPGSKPDGLDAYVRAVRSGL